jgi:hypothetical protein
MWTNESTADWMRRLHPLRVQYDMFSDANPFLRPLLANAADVRKNRRPISKDNALWEAQERWNNWVIGALNAYRDFRDDATEAWFHAFYGSPLLQALVGLKAFDSMARRKPGDDAGQNALVAQKIEELRGRISDGGPREAVIRALIYVRAPDGVVDERGFNLLRRMREETGQGINLPAFKQILREQFLMLLLDERRAVTAIPPMLRKDPDLTSRMKARFDRMIGLVGVHSDIGRARLAEIEAMLEREQPPILSLNSQSGVPKEHTIRNWKHH